MYVKKLLVHLSFFVLFSTGSFVEAATNSTTYSYLHTTGTSSDTATRVVTVTENGIVMHYKDTQSIQSESECTSSYAMKSWHFVNKPQGTDVTVKRNGTVLEITGTDKNRPIERSIGIDTLQWFQTLELSLLPFVKSNAASAEFWIMRPSDFSPHKMTVHRKSSDDARSPSDTAITELTISPSGLPEQLWRATLLFSSKNGEIISSTLPSFFPGRPPIIETLLAVSPKN